MTRLQLLGWVSVAVAAAFTVLDIVLLITRANRRARHMLAEMRLRHERERRLVDRWGAAMIRHATSKTATTLAFAHGWRRALIEATGRNEVER